MTSLLVPLASLLLTLLALLGALWAGTGRRARSGADRDVDRARGPEASGQRSSGDMTWLPRAFPRRSGRPPLPATVRSDEKDEKEESMEAAQHHTRPGPWPAAPDERSAGTGETRTTAGMPRRRHAPAPDTASPRPPAPAPDAGPSPRADGGDRTHPPHPHQIPHTRQSPREQPRPVSAGGLPEAPYGGDGRVTTAVTWLRPQGYVDWEGALRRAHWHGPASAFPAPGSTVRITTHPSSDALVLDAHPLG
ncbi:hypothetical protein [Streptomyces sp. NPDC007070]|uniref:hypothetical protein n=1 Tax=Streptomyces sp. NPDC007070 TaxID=3154312 RepID=UPI0033BFF99F